MGLAGVGVQVELVAKGLASCGKGVATASAASFHAMEELEEELDINVTEEEEEEEEEVGSGRTVETARQGREEGTSLVLVLKVCASRERETRNMAECGAASMSL